MLAHTIGKASGTYRFADLRDLLARATPLAQRASVLAGVAADSAKQRVAAQFTLAEKACPLEALPSASRSYPTKTTRSRASSWIRTIV